MIKGIHHLAYVVEELDEGIKLMKDGFGLELLGTVSLSYRGVKVAVFRLGDLLLELICPVKPGPVQEFLEKNGPGFFHIALEVDDINEAIEQCKLKGIKLKDEKPGPGINWKVASLDPENTLSVLTQFVEGPKEIGGGDDANNC